MTGTDLSASIEDVRESTEAVLDELKVVCGAGKLVDVSQHVIMASELGQTSDKDRHYAPMYKLSAYAHLGSTSGQRARSQGTRGHGTHRTAAGPWRVRTWMSWAMRVCRTLSVCNSVMSAGIMPFLATTSCVPRVVRDQNSAGRVNITLPRGIAGVPAPIAVSRTRGASPDAPLL